MSDYINREDAVDELQVKVFHNLTDEYYGTMQVLTELPAADVVPVVRCCDCKYREIRKWCNLHNGQFDDDAFCSYGERKD
jgi:hypothetical protein